MARLYFANIPYQSTEASISEWFEDAGFNATNIELGRDYETQKLIGFGFCDADQAAIAKLNGATMGGRKIKVQIANPRQSRYR